MTRTPIIADLGSTEFTSARAKPTAREIKKIDDARVGEVAKALLKKRHPKGRGGLNSSSISGWLRQLENYRELLPEPLAFPLGFTGALVAAAIEWYCRTPNPGHGIDGIIPAPANADSNKPIGRFFSVSPGIAVLAADVFYIDEDYFGVLREATEEERRYFTAEPKISLAPQGNNTTIELGLNKPSTAAPSSSPSPPPLTDIHPVEPKTSDLAQPLGMLVAAADMCRQIVLQKPELATKLHEHLGTLVVQLMNESVPSVPKTERNSQSDFSTGVLFGHAGEVPPVEHGTDPTPLLEGILAAVAPAPARRLSTVEILRLEEWLNVTPVKALADPTHYVLIFNRLLRASGYRVFTEKGTPCLLTTKRSLYKGNQITYVRFADSNGSIPGTPGKTKISLRPV